MDTELLPGFERRDIYMERAHGKSDFTGRRWQAAAKIVVRYFGQTPTWSILQLPLSACAATIARSGNRKRAAWSPPE